MSSSFETSGPSWNSDKMKKKETKKYDFSSFNTDLN